MIHDKCRMWVYSTHAIHMGMYMYCVLVCVCVVCHYFLVPCMNFNTILRYILAKSAPPHKYDYFDRSHWGLDCEILPFICTQDAEYDILQSIQTSYSSTSNRIFAQFIRDPYDGALFCWSCSSTSFTSHNDSPVNIVIFAS